MVFMTEMLSYCNTYSDEIKFMYRYEEVYEHWTILHETCRPKVSSSLHLLYVALSIDKLSSMLLKPILYQLHELNAYYSLLYEAC